MILLLQGGFPVPILPPPGGWNTQVIPFMLGLAATDILGIGLGIVFSCRSLIARRFNRRLGVLSLTIFITGAVVFGIGTFSSGAWGLHPAAYGTMVILFIPIIFLYHWLLTSNLKSSPP